MLSAKKGVVLLCVIAALVISVALAKQSPEETSFEKIGKIKRITFIPPIPGDCCSLPLTHIVFEDGDGLDLWGILDNLEEGKTYRIVYQEKEKTCINDDPTYKGFKKAKCNVVDEIEEIFP